MFPCEAVVVEALGVDVIAGRPFVRDYDISFRAATRQVFFPGGTAFVYETPIPPHSGVGSHIASVPQAPPISTSVWEEEESDALLSGDEEFLLLLGCGEADNLDAQRDAVTSVRQAPRTLPSAWKEEECDALQSEEESDALQSEEEFDALQSEEECDAPLSEEECDALPSEEECNVPLSGCVGPDDLDALCDAVAVNMDTPPLTVCYPDEQCDTIVAAVDPALPPVVDEFESVHRQAGLSTESSGLDDCDEDGSDAVPSVAPPSPPWSTMCSGSGVGSLLWLLPPAVRQLPEPHGFPEVTLSSVRSGFPVDVASPVPAIISAMAPASPTDLASFVVRPPRAPPDPCPEDGVVRPPRAPPDPCPEDGVVCPP